MKGGVYRKSEINDGMKENFSEKAFDEDTFSTENAKSKIESMLKKSKVIHRILSIFT